MSKAEQSSITDDGARAIIQDVAAKLDVIAALCHELGQPHDGARGGQIFTIGVGIESQRDRLQAAMGDAS